MATMINTMIIQTLIFLVSVYSKRSTDGNKGDFNWI